MAYTSGIFHIDLVSGSDAARTALTSCSVGNPSGSITRVTKAAHGLVTGAVVDLTLFTAWLNTAWKITVVDANNFDLDAATWQTTGDTSGTVTPRGGSSWSDAWLTITTGASAARIQPGDEIRVAKTEDPTSLGQNATWTDGSKDVVLTTAITKKIEDAVASANWTPSANITVGTNASRKIGATALTVTPAGAFTTGKVAYATIAGGGTQDFSGFTRISLWARPGSVTAITNIYRIYLCSDATGDTPVNILNVPSISNNTAWQALMIDYGAALGSNIQSVALYAVADPGTTVLSINNIFAHNSGFDLSTIIGPDAADCYYTIQSVDGTTISVDSNDTAAAGRGWSGTTGTTTLYYRNPFKVQVVSGSWQTMSEAGDTLTLPIHFSCGWDTGSNTRDGETCVSNIVAGVITSITCTSYSKLSYFVFARFATIVLNNPCTLDNVAGIGCQTVFNTSTLANIKLVDCKIYNASSNTVLGAAIECIRLKFFNNVSSLAVQNSQSFFNCEFRNNGGTSMTVTNILLNGTGALLLRKCILLDATEFSIAASWYNNFVWSYDHDDTPGNHWGFTYGGTINWQTSVVHGSEPGAWRLTTNQTTKRYLYPLRLKIAEVACAAGSLVTVEVWIKKDHATNIGASIYVEDEIYNIDGVVAAETIKADDTSWEELTLTFTPTEAGVVQVYAKTWYAAGHSSAYVGSVTITQA